HHLQEYLPFGLFFIIVGAAQVALAGAIVLMPSRKLFAWAAAGTLAVIGLWVVSRSVGLPFGPPEKIIGLRLGDPLGLLLVVATANGQLAGLLTSLLELFSLPFLALLLLRGPRRQRRKPAWLVALATVPVAVPIVALTLAGAAAEAHPLPYAVNMSSAVAGQPAVSLTSLVEPPGPQPVK